mmetsp:Transcript_11217/g.22347  ORF Transcript_11217/g.22347 Transcript_11217/m.22347 type:complete len:277 (-) Transcript_11217:625-1455(-)
MVLGWVTSGVGIWLREVQRVRSRCWCAARQNMLTVRGAGVTWLSREEAIDLDVQLMSPTYGFALETLMELAGQALAHVIVDHFGEKRLLQGGGPISVVVGPGNNGGDGLVAARHLVHFGYPVEMWYPKRNNRQPFVGLTRQLETLEVPFVDGISKHATAIVDCVFGFSFRVDRSVEPDGCVRPPFARVIETMNISQAPILSCDLPSGWDVDDGIQNGYPSVQAPEAILSLTLPKRGVSQFTGSHYCGGRFVPHVLAREKALQLPQYQGTQTFVRLS